MHEDIFYAQIRNARISPPPIFKYFELLAKRKSERSRAWDWIWQNFAFHPVRSFERSGSKWRASILVTSFGGCRLIHEESPFIFASLICASNNRNESSSPKEMQDFLFFTFLIFEFSSIDIRVNDCKDIWNCSNILYFIISFQRHDRRKNESWFVAYRFLIIEQKSCTNKSIIVRLLDRCWRSIFPRWKNEWNWASEE